MKRGSSLVRLHKALIIVPFVCTVNQGSCLSAVTFWHTTNWLIVTKLNRKRQYLVNVELVLWLVEHKCHFYQVCICKRKKSSGKNFICNKINFTGRNGLYQHESFETMQQLVESLEEASLRCFISSGVLLKFWACVGRCYNECREHSKHLRAAAANGRWSRSTKPVRTSAWPAMVQNSSGENFVSLSIAIMVKRTINKLSIFYALCDEAQFHQISASNCSQTPSMHKSISIHCLQ